MVCESLNLLLANWLRNVLLAIAEPSGAGNRVHCILRPKLGLAHLHFCLVLLVKVSQWLSSEMRNEKETTPYLVIGMAIANHMSELQEGIKNWGN